MKQRIIAKTKTIKKRGWALVRVSTETQGLTQAGSLDAQLNRINRWIESKNAHSFEIYEIVKVIKEEQSAFREKNLQRQGIMDLTILIKKGEVDFVIVEARCTSPRFYAISQNGLCFCNGWFCIAICD
jgi:predicted site-specific integrase-resolvase